MESSNLRMTNLTRRLVNKETSSEKMSPSRSSIQIATNKNFDEIMTEQDLHSSKINFSKKKARPSLNDFSKQRHSCEQVYS